MENLPDFSSMNETDVREIIVRPWIESLGYRHGTEATIRTEQPLRYGRSFLGRKNPKKDPELRGRADYICDVISYGRWVVEVKSPAEEITQDVVDQAHTYAAHPDIAASHFLVTNGRTFKLYQTSKLNSPFLEWEYEDRDENLLRVFNVLSPAAVIKRASASLSDPGKPLGKGLASQLRVLGGEILYEDYTGNVPFMQAQSINGLRLPVIGGSVHRTEDKRIRGHVEIAKAAALMFVGENELADSYDFFSASEYISDDPEHPSIFQNLVNYTTPAGKRLTFPGLGLIPMPFEISCSAFTEAAGYIKGGKFVGVAQLAFEFNLSKVPPQIRALMSARFGTIPDFAHMRGAGRFEISLSQDI